MKRLLAGFLLFAAPAAATISTVFVDTEGPCVRVSFDSDAGNENFSFYYGLDSDPTDEFRTEVLFASGANTRSTMTCDLPPSTKIYLLPEAGSAQFTCSTVCVGCDFGAGPTDAACDAIGEPPNVTTDAFTGLEAPLLPVHTFDPDAFCAGPPDTVRAVACEDGEETDFIALLNQAAADDTDQCHVVEIPAGCRVKRKVSFPVRSGAGGGSGGIVIRTAGDDRLFPPPGVRVDPTYQSYLARFEVPADRTSFGRTIAHSPFKFAAGANGYRFERVQFTLPDDPADVFLQRRVIGVSQPTPGGTVTIQLANGGGVNILDKVVLDLTGCDGLQGVKNVLTTGSSSFQIGGGYQITGACTGGRATFAASLEVAQVRNTTPVQVDTTTRHGLPNLESLVIQSITDNLDGTSRLSLAATQHRPFGFGPVYIRGNDVLMVSGSGTSLDGQLITASSGSTTSITVPGSVSCSADCGAVREFHVLQVDGTDLSCADGSRHFRVVDADTIELLGTTACGTSDHGKAAYDPAMIFAMVLIGSANSHIVFDRTLFDCGGFPYRTSRCIDFGNTAGNAVRNSFVRDVSFWMPVDPVSGEFRTTIHDGFVATPNAISMIASSDLRVENNTFTNVHGITLFNDQSTGHTRDRTIRRNLIHNPYRLLSGHPESDGRYYPNRHCFEAKSAERLLIEGLWCSGNWADWTPIGYALILSPRGLSGASNLGGVHHIKDVTIRGMYLERVAAGIQLVNETRPTFITGPTLRVSITDSLFAEIDYMENRSAPSGVAGPSKPNNFGGHMLTVFNGTAHLDFSRNTVGSQRGRGVPLVEMWNHASSLWRFDDNILSFNRNTTNFFGLAASSSEVDFTPGCQGLSGPPLWDCFVRRVGAGGGVSPDPFSSVSGNVIVGGIELANLSSEQAWLAARDATDDGTTLTDVEAAAYFANWGADDHLYPAGASWNDRLDATFESPGGGLRGWEPLSPVHDGKGADIRKLHAYLGVIGDVAVAELSPTSARLSYAAPEDGDLNPETCFVDYSLDPAFSDGWWSSGARIDDGGAAGLRQVDLTGLAPQSIYFWRLSCPASQARGELRTP